MMGDGFICLLLGSFDPLPHMTIYISSTGLYAPLRMYVAYTVIIYTIPEQFTAIGPPSFIWRGGGGREGKQKKTTRFFNTFIPVYIHIHIQYQTSKSNISKTVRDREKVSMEVR